MYFKFEKYCFILELSFLKKKRYSSAINKVKYVILVDDLKFLFINYFDEMLYDKNII